MKPTHDALDAVDRTPNTWGIALELVIDNKQSGCGGVEAKDKTRRPRGRQNRSERNVTEKANMYLSMDSEPIGRRPPGVINLE